MYISNSRTQFCEEKKKLKKDYITEKPIETENLHQIEIQNKQEAEERNQVKINKREKEKENQCQ